MSLRRRIVVVVVLLTGLALAAEVRADDPRQDARAHSNRARAAFAAGDFASALTEFNLAYELAPIPELLYNVARCHAELGQRAAALAAYRKYLAAKPNAEDRVDVDARIHELEQSLAANPEPAPVVTPPPVAPAAALVATPPPPRTNRPWYRKWWPWTIVGVGVVVVAGVATGVAVGTAKSSSNFPTITVNP